MGFLIGISSSCAQSPSSSLLLRANRRVSVVATCKHRDGHEEAYRVVSSGRRTLLVIGISILPLLQLKAVALEQDLSKVKQDLLRPAVFGRGRQAVTRKLAEQEQAPQKDSEKPATQDVAIPDQEKGPLAVNENGNATEEAAQVTVTEEPAQGEVKLFTQDSEPKKEGIKQPEQETVEKVEDQSENQFLALLKMLGLYSSGILGILYASARKDKNEIESNFALLQDKYSGKEKETFELRKDYEEALLKEKEGKNKLVKNFMKEETSLLGELKSTKKAIESLEKEVNNEKKIAEGLKSESGKLEGKIAQAEADKKLLVAKIKEKVDSIGVLEDKIGLINMEINEKEKSISELKSTISKKELELKNLNSSFDATKEKLEIANSNIEQLKGEVSNSREEMSQKESFINSLNEKIQSLDAEKSEMENKIEGLIRDCEDLRASSEKKAINDSELLSKKDQELQTVQQKLSLTLNEKTNCHERISELEKERDEIKIMLQKEVEITKNLQGELDSAKEALEASKLEASKLFNGLGEMKKSYEELLSNISQITNDFSEEKKNLTDKIEESNSAMKSLIEDLTSVQDLYNKSQESLASANHELNIVTEDRDNLKQELVSTYKKLESANFDLKEEKKLVSALNKEIEALIRKMNTDSDARKALELDLDEATKSLDAMNKSAMLLSKELENTNARNGTLEAEKGMLLKALNEQKDVFKEAKENLEDAQNVIERIGSERENLELRGKRLEEELASAKGEILRLRRQASNSMNESSKEKGLNVNHGSTSKRVTRRRKSGPGRVDF